MIPLDQSRIASIQRSDSGDRCEYYPFSYCEFAHCGPFSESFLEEETASGFEPFDESVSLGAFPGATGAGSASQNSAIEPNRILASGHYSGLGGYGTDFDSCDNSWEAYSGYEGGSWFSVSFVLETATPYTLAGSLEGWADLFWGPDYVSIVTRLTGPGGTVAEATCVFQPYEPSCGPVSLDESGVLPPGLYTLEVQAAGTAAADSWGGPPGGSNSGQFDIAVTLDQTPLPAASTPGLAVLVALIAALGARRVSRMLS